MIPQSIFVSNDDETYLQLFQALLNEAGYPTCGGSNLFPSSDVSHQEANMLSYQVLAIIIRRWDEGERAIDSESIYTELIHNGVVIPVGARADVFANLKVGGLVSGAKPTVSDAGLIHGGVVITRVSSTLL
jgi:hypothetical protein